MRACVNVHTYVFVCVCVHACVCVYVCVCGGAHVCVCFFFWGGGEICMGMGTVCSTVAVVYRYFSICILIHVFK